MKLVIGNKNYSSWSLRPWLLLRHFDVPFEEIAVALFTEGYQAELAKYSPTLRVPVLIDEDITVWDSLAICEYVSEKYTHGAALPGGIRARAICRAYCSEMHSGFMAIRSEMPMNCRARKKLQISADADTECRRVDRLFAEAREQFAAGGDYLFGAFSLADCMFAPIVMRFLTYGVELSKPSQEYVGKMLQNAALQEWVAAARTEPQNLPDFELGDDISP